MLVRKFSRTSLLEDFSTQKHQQNQITATTLKHTTMNSEVVNHFAKEKQKASKTNQQAYRIPMDHSNDVASLTYSPQTSNIFGQSGIIGMCHQMHQENGRLKGDVRRSRTHAKYTQLTDINVRKLDQQNASLHIDHQIFIGGKCNKNDGVNSEAKFTDALEILKSKRRLFLQSIQLVQSDSEMVGLFLDTNFPERGIRTTKNSPTERSVRINRQIEDNPSCKNFKDRGTFLSSKHSSPQPSKKLVVLTPAPKVMGTPEHVRCGCSSLHSHQRFKKEGQNVKPTYFSFKELKTIWKRAMGENQGKPQPVSSIVAPHKIPTRKCISTEAGDKENRGSSRRRHAYACGHNTKGDKSHEQRDFRPRNGTEISITDESVCRKLKPSTSYYSEHHESEIFEEAKKHLSERLRNVNRSEILQHRQTVGTLQRILCSPEDDMSLCSPKQKMKHSSISTESTFFPRFLTKDNQTSDGNAHNTHATVGTSDSEDGPEILGTNDVAKQEAVCTSEVPSEPINIDLTCAIHSPDTSCEGGGFNCSMLASPSSDQIIRSSSDVIPTSPISPPLLVDNIRDGEEHQSLVSVLEPLSMEDVGSPKSIKTQSFKGRLLQLQQIDSEEYGLVSPSDPKMKIIDCMNEDKGISTHMRAVLQAAGLNWDGPLLTRPLPDQVLDTSFSHVEKLSLTKSHLDPKLLFDCVNDVLLEIYGKHFGCSPWTLYLKPNTRGFPPEDHLVNEVVKDVKHLLLPQFAQPTLDELVGHDIAKSASWLDIRLATEELVNRITEDILEELVMGTVFKLQT